MVIYIYNPSKIDIFYLLFLVLLIMLTPSIIVTNNFQSIVNNDFIRRLHLRDEEICTMTPSDGQLEILKWARGFGCPWNENTCAYAVLNGHLEILKCLKENNCPWDKWKCSRAAESCHLEILKWMCLDELGRTYAANKGNLEIMVVLGI
jgi:hypothetical protein